MSQLPCAYCDAPIPLSEAEKTSLCPVCSRPLTVCGRYRLKELLSTSDADRVYTAVADDKKEVAVKVLLAREDDWAAISEFERIARTIQQLKDKALPQILAWEKGAQGRLILVREKCQGHSLETRLASGQRPPATAIRMMLDDLLSVLVDLHGQSPPMLHRDIRAGNILFRDQSWNPVLADLKPTGDGSSAQDLVDLGKTFESAGGGGMPVVAGLIAQKYVSARYALVALREETPPVSPAMRQNVAPSPRQESARRNRNAVRMLLFFLVGLPMIGGFISGFLETRRNKDPKYVAEHGDSTVQRYRSECDNNKAMSCYNLGYRYESGKGIAKSDQQAARLYQKACDLREYMGCNNLGVLYETGRGVVKDPPRAATLYQKACDGKDWLACRNLGYMYSNGVGVDKDPPRGATFYQKACDHDDMKGCFNLGVLYENGKGVDVDYARALTLYQRACDGSDWEACTNIGWAYASGHGAPANDEQARLFYQKGCDHNDARGCNNLGNIYEHGRKVTVDLAKAFALYKQACDGDDSYGCTNLGYFYESGKGTTKDLEQSTRLYQKGCKLGYDKGCNYFIDMCKDEKTKRTGLMLLQQACEGGDQWSCDQLKKLG
jgi:TPR repeat protein